MTPQVRRERRIKLLCLPLIALGLLQLGLAFISLPVYIQRMRTLTIVPYRMGLLEPLTNLAVQHAAAERGMSVAVYAVYQAAFNGSLSLFLAALAGLLLWKAHHQSFAWFTAAVLLMLSSYPLVEAPRQALMLPKVIGEAGSVFWPLFLLFFFVFPNGREQPAWARWPVGFLLLVHLAAQVFALLTVIWPGLEGIFTNASSLLAGSISLNFLLVLGCQVYRYLAVSTPAERQQTKIFLLALALMIFESNLVDQLRNFPFTSEANALTLVIVPVGVAVSILRYRLWDIDLIIRRTLLYGLLTALLGLVFFGGVTLLQGFFTAISGQQSPASVVISTLLIAALFNPLRRQLQQFIDRSFYRQKYDTAQALESFSKSVRNEVELEALTGRLERVVESTIQPLKISIWIRPAISPANLAAAAGEKDQQAAYSRLPQEAG